VWLISVVGAVVDGGPRWGHDDRMGALSFTRLAVSAVAVAGLVLAPTTASAAPGSAIHPVRPCAGLAGDFAIPGATTHVTAVEVVAATADDPEYCHVTGFVEPAVRFELKLPTSTFTGRYLQYGCGGFCGEITPSAFPDCGKPGVGDFAIASTDDGHVGKDPIPVLDGSWAANNQAARADFWFRAPHVVSLAAKRIIAAFYGAPPRHSYFNGCSNGGREGLLLAQRYPNDFDGIVAGAPAGYFDPLLVFQAWIWRSNLAADGTPIITSDKLPVLHSAVMAACDKLDGLVDGQLDEPRLCTFDPVALQCPAGPSCLTPAQVTAVRKMYAGPSDSAGRRLYPGAEMRGSELAWNEWILPFPGVGSPAQMLADNYLKYLGYPVGTPHSSVDAFRFTVPEFNRLTLEGYKGNAMSLDLARFRQAGGKLLIWHGWADEAIPPGSTLDYYQRLTQRNGGSQQTRQWARLFMVPSMYHCGGGDALTQFDPTKELVTWVERGAAPERILAQGVDPQTGAARTRPVFPYPLRAEYDGSGSVNDASNFRPASASVPPGGDAVDWVGDYLHGIPGPVA
jgi:pimeloyl-ACP methyl ester carboxylesterase